MELTVLDPFGDYQTQGYLRNFFKEKDLRLVGHLETAAFEAQVHQVIRFLRRRSLISYEHIRDTHRMLFDSVYPWAGQDRLQHAPNIAIAKGGYNKLFAHPADIGRAVDHALKRGQNRIELRAKPGEIFGYLAHAHPFLEGNGRTILTVYADLCRRAGFYIEWEALEKEVFLDSLTQELLKPGSAMDKLLMPHLHEGVLSVNKAAGQLTRNFNSNPSSDVGDVE
jgi:cell filamentation protein